MPMCQSPAIADILLRASNLPANDNYRFIKSESKPFQAKRPFTMVRHASLCLLCIGVLLLL